MKVLDGSIETRTGMHSLEYADFPIKAVEAGLTLTDLFATMKDTSEWLRDSDIIAAISPETEADLIYKSRNF